MKKTTVYRMSRTAVNQVLLETQEIFNNKSYFLADITLTDAGAKAYMKQGGWKKAVHSNVVFLEKQIVSEVDFKPTIYHKTIQKKQKGQGGVGW